MSSVTRTRNETGWLVSSQSVRLVVPNDLPVEVQESRVGSGRPELDIGDGRVGDDDPGQRRPGLDDLRFARDDGDLGLGVLDRLDQVGRRPWPPRCWAGGESARAAGREPAPSRRVRAGSSWAWQRLGGSTLILAPARSG